MILKAVKVGVVGVVGLAVLGGIVFGTDLLSYAGSTARTVRTSVKEAVPVEFELRRARDLLDQILPEMQANVRLIAQEEVEVSGLQREIEQCHDAVSQERTRLTKLREVLAVEKAAYTIGGMNYSRQNVKEELARRFDTLKEAEVVLSTKERLLEARQRSLQAAMQMLDRTKTQKVRLEDQIASLESQHRLIQAASVGSQVQIDGTKLAQTEKLISDIRKRLNVAERVLAHEARFTEAIPVDVIDEKDLLAQVDGYLTGGSLATTRPAEADAVALTSH